MDTTTKLFLLGALGAVAPEIVRLYSIATGRGQGFTWSWSYIGISFAFACLGGVVAVLLPSENVRAAFYAGISTPVIINTAAKKVRGRAKRKKKGPKASEQGTEARSRFDSFLDGL